jgi:hypothetical protein
LIQLAEPDVHQVECKSSFHRRRHARAPPSWCSVVGRPMLSSTTCVRSCS